MGSAFNGSKKMMRRRRQASGNLQILFGAEVRDNIGKELVRFETGHIVIPRCCLIDRHAGWLARSSQPFQCFSSLLARDHERKQVGPIRQRQVNEASALVSALVRQNNPVLLGNSRPDQWS